MRPQRGHALVEVLVGGALLAWAMSGISAGLVSSAADLGAAGEQQEAATWMEQGVEDLQALPLSQWISAPAGSQTVVHPAGHAQWARTTVWNGLRTEQYPTSGLVASATFVDVTVTVSYTRGRSLSTTLSRWTGR